MKYIYSAYLKKSGRIIIWKFIRLYSKGITTTESYSEKNNIILLNLVNSISLFSMLAMGVAFLLSGLHLQGIASLLMALFFLYPIYLNTQGKNLSAKIIATILVDGSLMICCCVFNHSSVLNSYFLFMATICMYLYTRKQRKWIVFSVALSAICFIIESTSLKNYLPALNLVTDAHELRISNTILLGGLLLLLIGELSAYVYFAEVREKKLANTRRLLIGSRKKLREQNEDLKAFGAAASHSLQTPIYISRAFIEKIKLHLAGLESPENTGKYFEIIDSGLLQMEHFVTGLFSYYKIIDMNTKIEKIDLSGELLILKKMMLQKYPAADIFLPPQKIIITDNRVMLSVILQNLMENALKYNRSAFPFVRIRTLFNADYFSILVEDNGIGIDEASREKIFHPFVRIPNEEAIEGTGLGLAGAKRAAEVMGARLYCEDSNSSGSVFRLDIPLAVND